ncbi:MAG: hypothetical protein M3M94_06005 [Actinomycetota bacterium]|nr:hypothetical protein [Actinomycetota bacterium]
MKLKLMTGVAAALSLFGTTALADNPPSTQDRQNAAQQCRAQRTAIGASAFRALYGTNANRSNAFGKCVSKMARVNHDARSNAQTQCRQEQNDPNFASTHGGKTFAEFYGTGKHGKNAFGRCVSLKAKAARQAEQHAIINAAKACKAERRADPDAFRMKYGTNRNGKNAFGKCVAAKARQG